MRVSHWLRPLADRLFRSRPRPITQRPAFRPRVENLEDRTTPSGGLLDPTFNGTGTRTLPQATCREVLAVAVQPDGKIVSVGWSASGAAVVRMNADGTLDRTFNGTGSVTLSVDAGARGREPSPCSRTARSWSAAARR